MHNESTTFPNKTLILSLASQNQGFRPKKMSHTSARRKNRCEYVDPDKHNSKTMHSGKIMKVDRVPFMARLL